MNNYSKAYYVSVWDDGIEIRTACQFNPETRDVTDIESVDVAGLETLLEEYIELLNGTIVTEGFTVDGEPY